MIFLGLFIVLLVVLIRYANVHPFIALLVSGILYGLSAGMTFETTFETLINGFASTVEWIGIVIIFGAVIGEILSDTGAAQLIANLVLKIIGEKRLAQVMGMTGYLIGIPVFVDVAYVMLQPITESLAAKSGKKILVIGLALAAGLTTTHALIPPTPGPIAAAGIMEANLGKVIIINMFVAIFAVTGGIIWASLYCKKYELQYDSIIRENLSRRNTESKSKYSTKNIFLSISPIFIPLILIAVGSISNASEDFIGKSFMKILGTPAIALFIGMLIASFLLPKKSITKTISSILDRSIEKIAVVLMITAAGGAFGAIIKASEVGNSVATSISSIGLPAIIFPFVLAVGLTTSTGSITVALVTASSIVAPMIDSLGISPELAVALVGAGSLSVIHTNSSFFWLIGRSHQIPTNILLKSFSLQTVFMSLSGFGAILILYFLGIV